MARATVLVNNKTGLHARPASEFAKLANSQSCDVSLEKAGKRINAKSVLGILTLGISQGEEVEIITEGANEESALEALVSFVGQLTD